MALPPGFEVLLAIVALSLVMGLIGAWRGVGFASAAVAAIALYFFLGTLLVLPMIAVRSDVSHTAFYWTAAGITAAVLLSPLLVIWHKPRDS